MANTLRQHGEHIKTTRRTHLDNNANTLNTTTWRTHQDNMANTLRQPGEHIKRTRGTH